MRIVTAMLFFLISGVCLAADLKLDESAAQPGPWSYRPEAGTASQVNPPGFSWRPQREIAHWELQCGRRESFDDIQYSAGKLAWNVRCPPVVFPPGQYTWRYRGASGFDGSPSLSAVESAAAVWTVVRSARHFTSALSASAANDNGPERPGIVLARSVFQGLEPLGVAI